MKTCLGHLSDNEISSIKQRYYQGESVYQLLSEYGLNIAPARFYKLLPPEKVEKYGCRKCGVNLVVDALPRAKQDQFINPKLFYCPICGKRPFVENRDDLSFPLLSESEISSIRDYIRQFHDTHSHPISYATLSLTQKIYLAALCSSQLDNEQVIISPIYGSQIFLASTKELQQNIYSELSKCGAIIVDPTFSLDAFDLDNIYSPINYDYEKVRYLLNTEGNRYAFDTPVGSILSIHSSELLALWTDIALGECISYLLYWFEKIGFSFSPGKKTQLIFRELLTNFSVAQIYYIIWCKVNDASRWYLEGSVTKHHAACSVISACQRYGENALFFKRELPKYRRPADCPHSILTQFFYNKVLSIGPDADNICPSTFINSIKSEC